eukprot:6178370-Pleurochrysis_carterae.AAC.3
MTAIGETPPAKCESANASLLRQFATAQQRNVRSKWGVERDAVDANDVYESDPLWIPPRVLLRLLLARVAAGGVGAWSAWMRARDCSPFCVPSFYAI